MHRFRRGLDRAYDLTRSGVAAARQFSEVADLLDRAVTDQTRINFLEDAIGRERAISAALIARLAATTGERDAANLLLDVATEALSREILR